MQTGSCTCVLALDWITAPSPPVLPCSREPQLSAGCRGNGQSRIVLVANNELSMRTYVSGPKNRSLDKNIV